VAQERKNKKRKIRHIVLPKEQKKKKDRPLHFSYPTSPIHLLATIPHCYATISPAYIETKLRCCSIEV